MLLAAAPIGEQLRRSDTSEPLSRTYSLSTCHEVQADFKRPVDVGDLVSFESRVLHTRNILEPATGTRPRAEVFVEVNALINRPEHVCTMATNRFTIMCASLGHNVAG